MKSTRWVVGFLVVVVVAATSTAVVLFNRPIQQPIGFNHAAHVEDVGMECTDCHLYAKTGVRATIPNIDVCVDCHEEPQGDSPEEARVVEYVGEHALIPWRKIYRMPSHVYFSHRRHTVAGGIACETCHGDVGARVDPVVRPLVELTMEACIRCHEASHTSSDCILCHR